MSTSINRQGVVAVITRAEKLLVIKRSQFVTAPGTFCFPGGGIETGETEEQALRRELQEELAIDVTPIRRLWQNTTHWQTDLTWWLATASQHATPEPNPSEVETFHWLTLSEIRSLPELLQSNHSFLDALEVGKFHLRCNPA